jgi:hypothetical protein
MIHWPIHPGLLAEEEIGGAYRILFFVVIFLGWLISAVLKKQSEKKEQERAERRAQEMKQELAENRKTAPPPRLGYGWQAVPPPEEENEVHSVFEAESAYRESVIELQPVPSAPPEAPEVYHPKKAVRDLLRRRQEATVSPPVAPPVTAAPSMPAIPAAGLPPTREIKTRVNLSDARTARAAIIFQEILSSPKALRHNPELWD